MRDLLTEARSRLRHEPIERRVRAVVESATVVDSTRALLVYEPRRVVPSFGVPEATSVRRCPGAPSIERRRARASCIRVSRSPFIRPTASRWRSATAPVPGSGLPSDLDGYVELDFTAIRRVVRGGRADLRPPARPVSPRRRAAPARGRCGSSSAGRSLAETTRARMAYETQLDDPLLPPARGRARSRCGASEAAFVLPV